jgi:hypothetical protein
MVKYALIVAVLLAGCGGAVAPAERFCRCVARLGCQREVLSFGAEGALAPSAECPHRQAESCLASESWRPVGERSPARALIPIVEHPSPEDVPECADELGRGRWSAQFALPNKRLHLTGHRVVLGRW